MEKIINQNRKIGIRSIAAQLNLNYSATQRAIRDRLALKKVFARWVPFKLNATQKGSRVACAREVLAKWQNKWDELMQLLITSDETWISYETPDTAQTSAEWRRAGEEPPERPRVASNRKKLMLTIFWDARGVIMTDYFRQTSRMGMNGGYYTELIGKLHQKLACEKRRGMRTKGPILLIDNAPIHRTPAVSLKMERCGFRQLAHPPYSPDLAPSDYHLFRVLKNWLRGRKFSSEEEVIDAVETWFRGKPASFYSGALEKLREKLITVIEREGNYLVE